MPVEGLLGGGESAAELLRALLSQGAEAEEVPALAPEEARRQALLQGILAARDIEPTGPGDLTRVLLPLAIANLGQGQLLREDRRERATSRRQELRDALGIMSALSRMGVNEAKIKALAEQEGFGAEEAAALADTYRKLGLGDISVTRGPKGTSVTGRTPRRGKAAAASRLERLATTLDPKGNVVLTLREPKSGKIFEHETGRPPVASQAGFPLEAIFGRREPSPTPAETRGAVAEAEAAVSEEETVFRLEMAEVDRMLASGSAVSEVRVAVETMGEKAEQEGRTIDAAIWRRVLDEHPRLGTARRTPVPTGSSIALPVPSPTPRPR